MGILQRLFNIDQRALAAFRTLTGICLIFDLAIRLGDFRAHYSNDGVMPFDVVRNAMLLPMHFTFHLTDTLSLVMFGVALLAAFCLVVNVQARLATFVTWVLLVSLQHRNPLVIQGGDTVLRLYLFWAMFLPMQAPFSRNHGKVKALYSVASAALLLQICAVYWFSVALKSHAAWRVDFSAVYYALNIEQYASPLGRWLLSFKQILPALTIATLVVETFFPFIALVGYRIPIFKMLAALGMMLLHVSFGLAFELGTFPYISILGWILFLPANFWDWLEMRLINVCRPRTFCRKILHCISHERPRWFESRRALQISGIVAAVACTLLAFFWNLRTLHILPHQNNWPRLLDIPVHVLRLDQFWGMFGPRPPSEDGWFVAPAQLADDNRIVDAITARPVVWDKPALVSASFRNDKWRKYMNNLTYAHYAQYRKYFGNYLCWRWQTGGKPLRELRVFFMMESTLPEIGKGPVKKYEIVNQKCALPHS